MIELRLKRRWTGVLTCKEFVSMQWYNWEMKSWKKDFWSILRYSSALDIESIVLFILLNGTMFIENSDFPTFHLLYCVSVMMLNSFTYRFFLCPSLFQSYCRYPLGLCVVMTNISIFIDSSKMGIKSGHTYRKMKRYQDERHK